MTQLRHGPEIAERFVVDENSESVAFDGLDELDNDCCNASSLFAGDRTIF